MLKNRRSWAVAIGLGLGALLLTGCARSTVAGQYIARFTNGVYRLQLVESQDGHVSGQLDDVIVNSGGKVEYDSFAATGVTDGTNISLSFKQASLLPTNLSGSGIIDGNRLSLTGNINPGKLSTVIFVRATDAQYQAVVNNLIGEVNTAAAAEIAEKARQTLLARRRAFALGVAQLIAQLKNFDLHADTFLAHWPDPIRQYREVTAQMTTYLNQERGLAGSDTMSVERGQIGVAISQLAIRTE